MVSDWSCTLYKVVWKKTVLIIHALSMCIHFNSLGLKNGSCLYHCFWFVYFYSYWIILEVQRQYYPLPSGNKRNKGYRSNPSQLSQRIQRIHSAKGRRHNKLNANLMGCPKKKEKRLKISDNTFFGSLTTSKNILGQQLSLTQEMHSERQVILPLNPDQEKNPHSTSLGKLNSRALNT